MCHLLALEYTKNPTIIMVLHLDDPVWVLLLGQCSPDTVVRDLFDQVPETLQKIIPPSAGVEERV